MKKLLGALAVAGMAVVFSTSNADAARCWWNGYTWVCHTRPYAGYWWRHPHWRVAHGPWWYYHPWHRWGYGRPYAWYR